MYTFYSYLFGLYLHGFDSVDEEQKMGIQMWIYMVGEVIYIFTVTHLAYIYISSCVSIIHLIQRW